MGLFERSSELKLNRLGVVKLALRRFGLFGSAARYVLLQDELRRFVRAGADEVAREQRLAILDRFAKIHRMVPCAHSPAQFTIIAEHLLELDVPGDIVQCGAFKGGSTAKLSVLAKLTGRRLYVCDSFEGLPETHEGTQRFVAHDRSTDYVFSPGEYAGTLDEVRTNVMRAGELDVCTFVPGWFSNTLPTLEVEPALVFTDVDYVSSARDCLRSLWPRLRPGGVWFTHEAMFLTYVEGMMDPEWWLEQLHEAPPVLIGGGAGVSPAAPSLAYFRKKRSA
jgi:O-methyltransferase